MDFDNPSYFSISSGTSTLPSPSRNKFGLFKRRGIKKMGTNLSSPSSTFETSSPESSVVGTPNFPSSILTSNCPQNRTAMRTLLRSVSANSAESNQELLILGEPRPSDIAPLSPYMPRGSFKSEWESLKKTRSLRRSTKTSSELLHEDLVYCPLPSSDNETDNLSETIDEEEVFLGDDSARYYNLRRHSIGTSYYNRGRKSSMASTTRSLKETALREDFPQAIIHATADGDIVKPTVVNKEQNGGHAVQMKKKCSRCAASKGAKKIKSSSTVNSTCSNMDDIMIVSSRDNKAATLWVTYLTTCFEKGDQKPSRNPKVFHITLEEITAGNISGPVEERISNVKLQILIVCPTLLQYVANNSNVLNRAFSKLFHPDRVLAMLLGVNEGIITEQHRAGLSSYYNWRRIVVRDQDETFVNEFLEIATSIISKISRQIYSLAQQEKAQFSIVPKKVKTGQRRVIVLLNDPLQKEDVISIVVEKSGEKLGINTVKRRNPYTLQFSIPDCCLDVSIIVNVVIEKNGSILGSQPVKCESRLRELDQILRSNDNPLDFMCQTLGFSPSNREQLDNWMVYSFQRNIPPHFNLLSTASHSGVISNNKHSPEEYPTLLHFAARFGLEKLAWQLLECPGGEQACEIRNACELTPTEMAESAGNLKLAQALKGYMQMNEFSNMYQMLKGMSEDRNKLNGGSDDEYLCPKPLGETYSVPPSARPFIPQDNTVSSLSGYMEMHPSGKTISLQQTTQKFSESTSENSSLSSATTPSDRFTEIKNLTNILSESPNNTKTYRQNSNPSPTSLEVTMKMRNLNLEDRVQSELADIITDFKNNVFTIQEVEKLVDNWKNRNDVQQSFKEKQDALVKMREEYDRIQKIMKDDVKMTSFERFKKFFTRSKSKNCDESGKDKIISPPHEVTQEKNVSDPLCNIHRPISSLSCRSTSSSSSSARMSTVSGCSAASFGDSGTHSDIDDRRNTLHNNSDMESLSNKSMNFNYLIPPTPKPVQNKTTLSGRTSPRTSWKFTTIEERPPLPIPKPNDIKNDSYYIKFPPSGLPVNGNSNRMTQNKNTEDNPPEYLELNPASSDQNNYTDNNEQFTNLNNNEDTTDMFPEYMNYVPPEIKKSTPPPLLPKRSI